MAGDTNQLRHAEGGPAYAAPTLRVIGSVHELTQTLCILNKTLGSPDYWGHIPVTNCSA